MISNDPKFNLGQPNAYKVMFAIKLSMEKRIKEFLAAWFCDLPAINPTVFTWSHSVSPLSYLLLQNLSFNLNWALENHSTIESNATGSAGCTRSSACIGFCGHKTNFK